MKEDYANYGIEVSFGKRDSKRSGDITDRVEQSRTTFGSRENCGLAFEEIMKTLDALLEKTKNEAP